MASPEPSTAPQLERLLGYLHQDPQNPRLLGEAFDVALGSGSFDVARALLQQSLGAWPEDVAWQNREGLLLLATGECALAGEVFGRLRAQGLDDAGIRYNHAYSIFGQGQYESALQALDGLLDQDGELGDLAQVLWLRCQHHTHRFDEPLKAFMASSRPLSPEAWGIASLMAVDLEWMEEARAWSDRALAARPDQLEALVARGSLALGDQNSAQAKELFQRALAIHPTDGRTWSGMAFTRMLEMDFSGAKEAFTHAVAAMTDHIGTWIGLGWCEWFNQQPQAAQAAFERALELNRNFAECHGGLAVVLAQTGPREAAEAEIERALRLDPRCLSARFAQSLLSGEASDVAAFQKLSRRALSQIPVPGPGNRTLADLVCRTKAQNS